MTSTPYLSAWDNNISWAILTTLHANAVRSAYQFIFGARLYNDFSILIARLFRAATRRAVSRWAGRGRTVWERIRSISSRTICLVLGGWEAAPAGFWGGIDSQCWLLHDNNMEYGRSMIYYLMRCQISDFQLMLTCQVWKMESSVVGGGRAAFSGWWLVTVFCDLTA